MLFVSRLMYEAFTFNWSIVPLSAENMLPGVTALTDMNKVKFKSVKYCCVTINVLL